VSEENKDMVRRMVEAINAGGEAVAVDELFAQDIVNAEMDRLEPEKASV
jgi:hypothetical protein